jgi:hypothetical protein
MHRVLAADSYPSAGINRIRFIGLMPDASLSPKAGTPLSEAENAAGGGEMSRVTPNNPTTSSGIIDSRRDLNP